MITVVTLHDLNLAVAFCDRLVVLSRGAVVAAGCHRNSLLHLLTFRLCLSFFSGRTVKQLDEVLTAISPKIRAPRMPSSVERANT